MTIVYVGIDLAKNVFAVHGVNQAGRSEPVRTSVPRARLHELIASGHHQTRRHLPAQPADPGRQVGRDDGPQAQ